MKQFGYIKDQFDEKDYVLGSLKIPTEVLQSDGQWDGFISQDELQRNEWIETYNCTGYGTCHALSFLLKRLFGKSEDWSERYVGIAAGTYPPGNSPQVVIESIRKNSGLLPESVLPFNNTIKTVDEYYSPKPVPWLMRENGRKFLDEYKIGYEWVWSDEQLLNRANSLKYALQFSPIGIAVYAWQFDCDKKVYVRPEGKEDNHFCVLYGYEEGKYWKVYDSYDRSLKSLDWSYPFYRAIRYHIEKIVHKSFCGYIKEYFLQLIK